MNRPKTILTDLDGTLIKHHGDITKQHIYEAEVLPGVLDKIRLWDKLGYKIILVSGRRESTRQDTERQLANAGIIYDQLILSITGGERILINDLKPENDKPTASAINVERNKGLENI